MLAVRSVCFHHPFSMCNIKLRSLVRTGFFGMAILSTIGLCIFAYYDFLETSNRPKQIPKHIIYQELDKNNYKRLQYARSREQVILLWDGYPDMGNTRWPISGSMATSGFLQNILKCPEYRCMITIERDFLQNVEEYDAIVFHTKKQSTAPPELRVPDQYYVFGMMHSPKELSDEIEHAPGMYNLTMTYRLDSDVLASPVRVIDDQTGLQVAPSKTPTWRQPEPYYRDSIAKDYYSKTVTSAYFSTKCQTNSDAEKLAWKMAELMEVEFLGACGDTPSCDLLTHRCDRFLSERYKFMFVFEDSLCPDYISDFILAVINANVIPVVFGSANYSQFLPPKSYLDYKDFSQAEDLADKMIDITKGVHAYSSYFWWHEHYTILPSEPYCNLCERIHHSAKKQKVQIYHDIHNYWMSGCSPFKNGF